MDYRHADTPGEAAAPSTPHAADVGRRDALKAIAAAAAALPLASAEAHAQPPAARAAARRPARKPLPVAGPRGTAWDPDLLNTTADWPRVLTVAELTTLAALCDMIIPADAKSPSASAVGAHRYIDEVVSAPYDWAERTQARIRGGLVWLDRESQRRFGRSFVGLTVAERTQICDDICFTKTAKPEFKAGARFFDEVRDLTATGFYTTDAGMQDIGYVGNRALPRWEPPPREVLERLGLV
ncbi:MAG: gluconate 2-dehydrogenase subunit 3 family protein [Gemmatimonadaceae bacterium]|nr:gluconate 2-dehydrogenase subunit 3 family protein [Gemmatimonadaceae bacterium]